MTIAVGYLSPEGLVIGADSTATYPAGTLNQYFDHHQKILEIGEKSTLGVAAWGLGSFGTKSYRSCVAEFSDELQVHAPDSMQAVAMRWASRVWSEYTSAFASQIQRYRDLIRINPRSDQETNELHQLASLSGGFCIGGRLLTSRMPEAFAVTYGPEMDSPSISPMIYDQPQFWGVPNLMHRLIFGTDDGLFGRILNSDKWTGTPEDLYALIKPGVLTIPGRLPIREAIDWVYSSIFITIKAIKFSSLPSVCGGPIEIAVITSDRPFRWVKHKRMDEVLRQVSSQGEVP